MYTLSGKLIHERINGANRENYYLGSQLVAHQGAGEKKYIHPDVLGGTAATTNAAKSPERTRYAPYGSAWGHTPKNEIGYTGHKQDSDTGLVYMQARYYDPVIGRFYSNDPVGFSNVHNFNRYAYANNNPYKYVDPDGRDAVAIVFPDYKISVAGTKVSNLGHAGLLNINPDTGLTRYYEFGRYGNDGMVRNIRLDNDVVMSGGAPTSASLAKVLAEISSKSGQGGQYPLPISLELISLQ